MGVKHPVDIPMTCHAWLSHAIPNIRKAMEFAWRKHGEPTKDRQRGALNLCEEAGEVAKEALDATRQYTIQATDSGMRDSLQRIHDKARYAAENQMIAELYQVAGYAILLAVQLEGKQEAQA